MNNVVLIWIETQLAINPKSSLLRTSIWITKKQSQYIYTKMCNLFISEQIFDSLFILKIILIKKIILVCNYTHKIYVLFLE